MKICKGEGKIPHTTIAQEERHDGQCVLCMALAQNQLLERGSQSSDGAYMEGDEKMNPDEQPVDKWDKTHGMMGQLKVQDTREEGKMKVTTLVQQAHDTALLKGWWTGTERSPLEIAALIHSEISEFVEECRKKKPCACGMWTEVGDDKPEGPSVELADAVIRIADYFGKMGWDLEEVLRIKMAYNARREDRHGGKLY